ncbi:hypothetical protein [Salinispora sp. H7-4]|uniref:hypothetical protein n=1 Tax=Salinispora sp. H7-4 TaxID=2748321 RepID=UPI0015D1C449|nr:hypothetical protein [Salinispora sp. H7-4]NYT93822.1 hypothetical protein [Salinispora sp. H7-4]
MNEITLLQEHGPDSAPATKSVLNSARHRLLTEIADATEPRQRWAGLHRQHGFQRARVLAMTVVAASALFVFSVVVGGVISAEQSRDRTPVAVSLVAFQMPVFPLALDPVPAGLTAPFFDLDGRFLAGYRATDGESGVSLIVYDQRPDPRETTRLVTVHGQRGELWEDQLGQGAAAGERSQNGATRVSVMWEREPGQWVRVTGRGRFGTEAAVLALADTVVERPQEVPLQVRLAPAGWEVFAFKDDRILTLKDENSDATMNVHLAERPQPDLLGNVMGAQEVSTVQVNGREAHLVRADEIWFRQVPLPDGSVFNLQAPLFMTADQVVAIGEQVTVER